MKTILVIFLFFTLVSCASIKSYRNIDQATNEILTTSIGGTIFRVNRTSDLPNVFGKADLYGGKVDRGYAEVKFKGLNDEGKLILQVTDMHKGSSETTMDRYAPSSRIQANQNVSIGNTNTPEAETFIFDLSKEKELVIAGIKIIFLSSKSYSVTYKIIDLKNHGA